MRALGKRIALTVTLCALAGSALAQTAQTGPGGPYGMPLDDNRVYVHILLEQFEYRTGKGAGDLSWGGQAWIGTDTSRLWLKTEGVREKDGTIEGGQHELLYSRPISIYFDLQAGLRFDVDSKPGRNWAAFGIQGLAPYFFEVSATTYVSDRGNFAVNFEGSFDLLLTQRLIVQPQLELDLYSKGDPARRIGSGLAEIGTGLRLRYEISRKFAPYIGLSYQRNFGQTRRYASADGEDNGHPLLVIGVRSWF